MADPETSALDQLRLALETGLIDKAKLNVELAGILAKLDGAGALAQGNGATAVGAGGVAGENNSGQINTGQQINAGEGAQIVYAESGATVVIGDAPVAMPAVDRESALGRYLQHLISQNRYLQLQGIRSGGKLVNIELDRIYVTLRTTRQVAARMAADWLDGESAFAPGERHRAPGAETPADITQLTVNQALAEHPRLVVLGDPGSGKTTLLRYLALLHARDRAEGTRSAAEKLGLAANGVLPILLPLRQIGRYLAERHPQESGTEGHAILLHFLAELLRNERIEVPADFFDAWLRDGHAAILLDGLDEVADPDLRRRVSRLVDAFTRAYPDCRYVVTSRIVGYTETSQLAEGYAAATVRDFSLEDVKTFLSQWHRLVAIGQMGPGATAEAAAAAQTRQLLDAIERNDRVRELAINPLMLTVIALVHRDRVKLPDRRAELYQEAVDVLLGKWDEARGVQESLILNDRPFDISDRRLVLQQLALRMHEQAVKEIDAGPLREFLKAQLQDAVTDPRDLEASVERFQDVIQARTGLLIARAERTYAFSHLTFQEYLAALAIAGRDDYVDYTLARTAAPWWREVVLLEAGYLSTQSKEKTTRLIRAIADAKAEPALYHNLVLAAECVRDAGANRIVGDLEADLRGRLQRELEAPTKAGTVGKLFATLTRRNQAPAAAFSRRIAAAEALDTLGGTRFWSLPHGEPEWMEIPAGAFTMGEPGEAHRVELPDFAIAKAPITNAQYLLFVQATGHAPPKHWNGKRPPRGKEGHPVVEVTWFDAQAYCDWLRAELGKPVALPSEAEWEKAARGTKFALTYPWGNEFDAARCNVTESGFGGTTPVGIFPTGASPCGCLDMAGNVWEWTRSRYEGRGEPVEVCQPHAMVLRGGSWYNPTDNTRCAYRDDNLSDNRFGDVGFRVVLRFSPVS